MWPASFTAAVFVCVSSTQPRRKERLEPQVGSADGASADVLWLLVVSISLLTLEVHTSVECVSFQAMCVLACLFFFFFPLN